MHRLYENGDIVVFWNSDKCFKAKRCVHGSSKTFDPSRRPWIDLNAAETKEIWQAIEQCPSGALTCVYRHDVDVTLDSANCRSVAFLNGKKIGECDYEVTEAGWNIYHTEVDPEHGGKGIARRLVYKILEDAERKKVNVVATCSYAVKVMGE